jgi:anti-sigma regulatory factor (Ser/Thr protein kinase)
MLGVEAVADSLELELPARSSSVGRARHAAERLARAAGIPGSNVALAVSEAVSNAVRHAYRGREGRITVHACRSPGRLVLEVIDRGVGMRPDPEGQGLGLGLSLIGLVADDFEIDAGAEGTTLKMRFTAAGQRRR